MNSMCGTGLYQIDGLEIVDSIDIDTPFGKPSDSIKIAKFDERVAAFLPRHGVGHRYLPTLQTQPRLEHTAKKNVSLYPFFPV